MDNLKIESHRDPHSDRVLDRQLGSGWRAVGRHSFASALMPYISQDVWRADERSSFARNLAIFGSLISNPPFGFSFVPHETVSLPCQLHSSHARPSPSVQHCRVRKRVGKRGRSVGNWLMNRDPQAAYKSERVCRQNRPTWELAFCQGPTPLCHLTAAGLCSYRETGRSTPPFFPLLIYILYPQLTNTLRNTQRQCIGLALHYGQSGAVGIAVVCNFNRFDKPSSPSFGY